MAEQRDSLGQSYQGDQKAVSGQQVQLNTANGPVPATVISGIAVPNKPA